MLFNSLSFVIFFAVISSSYFALTHRYRWVLLLAGSYFFYMCWKPEYIFLIVLSTVIDYTAAIQMSRASNLLVKRSFLILSIISNLGILFWFKYYNFFSDSISSALAHFDISYQMPIIDILLPVGISFYTFQTLSYSIDVYRGQTKPETHIGRFALYVSFFPQLVAGPIERSYRLLPQIDKLKNWDYDRVTSGLRLIVWGLFKKIVIADRLALYVNLIYHQPTDYQGLSLILATYFFAFQIYCDFSGYSDIAIGCARILGFDLMKNFDQPYFSSSIAEFWSRWHISLSTWFKDYLYIPIGGNRVAQWRWYLNLLIVFLVSGLWHGANWTFVVWGALHGLYHVVGKSTERARKRLMATLPVNPYIRRIAQVVFTFHVVTLAWVYFRANSLADANYIMMNMFVNLSQPIDFGPSKFTTLLSVSLLIIFIMLEWGHRYLKPRFEKPVSWPRFAMECPAYCLFLVAICLFGVNANQFIYFQF